MKKTPLYKYHLDLGAKLADFAGYEMPIQYQGIIDEHMERTWGVLVAMDE